MAASIEHHDRVAADRKEKPGESATLADVVALELDAVVKATEAASNTIMECAEAVLASDASDAAAFKAMVDQHMLVIFEACSFQDIAGQRIAKVVETLEHIEARLARFTEAMRAKDADRFVSAEERASAERRERLLLHGPQLPDRSNAQGDVDALMAEQP
jgi:chemotaxis protein CheZ